jgi:hypothetical protein
MLMRSIKLKLDALITIAVVGELSAYTPTSMTTLLDDPRDGGKKEIL